MEDRLKSTDFVYGFRISSVGPGTETGSHMSYEPSNMDLAMKLHYHRVVYLFDQKAVELAELTVPKLKESSFTWLNYYYESCGRFRRLESSGRPYIKCNDCGVRFIEAQSSKTLEEWMVLNIKDSSCLRLLVPSQVIGPELTFSPLVFIQVTRLKCGGAALGLSCAHVLGDFFSITKYMSFWAQIFSGYRPIHSPDLNKIKNHDLNTPKLYNSPEAQSLKLVDPVGDHWILPTPSKMGTFSFHLTPSELAHLWTTVHGPNEPTPFSQFETICGLIWWAVAQSTDGPEPSRVTVIKEDKSDGEIYEKNKEVLRNTQTLGVVEADFSVRDAHPKKLARLIGNNVVDERDRISEMVASNEGGSDFMMYGANLTFVNLEGANCYGFVLKGHEPCLVNWFIDGMGEKGAVLVLQGPEEAADKGRMVTMILPEDQILNVRQKLAKERLIIDDGLRG